MAFYTKSGFGPECSLGYLARRIYQIGQGLIEPIFADEGLSGTQWSALMSICTERAATCADLARDLAHDKGATTRLVDTLEQRGWVTRSRAVEDRRIINLELTPDGAAVGLRCRDRVIDYWNILLADWDRAEVESLIASMQKLRETLDDAATRGIRP